MEDSLVPYTSGSIDVSMIDDSYEDFEEIISALPCEDESPLERYEHFDTATEFINYVQDVIELGEDDIDRVLQELEDDRCHLCEEEYLMALTGDADSDSVDPSLEKTSWQEREGSMLEGADEKVTGSFMAYCPTHSEETLFKYSESWHE